MADADSSRTRLRYRTEAAFNEATPANPPFTDLRFTRANFKQSNNKVVSNEIRDDRMRSDELLVGTEVAGGFSFELSDGSYEAFMAAVLSGAWATGVLKNGIVAPVSYAFEVGFLDIAQHLLFKGCSVNEWNLVAASRAIVTGDFGFMGTLSAINALSVAGTGTITPKTTTPAMVSGPGINNILINGAPIGVGVREIRLNVRGNLRAREVLDSAVSRQHGRGPLDVTGSIAVYFANAALYAYFLSNASFALAFTISDNVSKAYDFVIPNCKVSDDSGGEVSGIDSDIIETINFRALFDPVSNCEIQITRRTF